MSDNKSTKRPAHEVIIHKMKERIVWLQRFCGCNTDTHHARCRISEEISTLCEVLNAMIIPEKERERVLLELRQIASMWTARVDRHNTIEESYIALSRKR